MRESEGGGRGSSSTDRDLEEAVSLIDEAVAAGAPSPVEAATAQAKEYPDSSEGYAACALEVEIIPKVFTCGDSHSQHGDRYTVSRQSGGHGEEYEDVFEDDEGEMVPFETLQLNFSSRAGGNRALNFETDFEPLEPSPPLLSEVASAASLSASAANSGGKAAVLIDYGAEDEDGDAGDVGFGIMSAVSAALEGLTVDLQRRRMDLAYEWKRNETAYAEAGSGIKCSNRPSNTFANPRFLTNFTMRCLSNFCQALCQGGAAA